MHFRTARNDVPGAHDEAMTREEYKSSRKAWKEYCTRDARKAKAEKVVLKAFRDFEKSLKQATKAQAISARKSNA